MAWKSTWKCRLIFSAGSTYDWPPPAAPPFMLKMGHCEGSREKRMARLPMRSSPWTRPTEVTVLHPLCYDALYEAFSSRLWSRAHCHRHRLVFARRQRPARQFHDGSNQMGTDRCRLLRRWCDLSGFLEVILASEEANQYSQF